MTESLSPFWWNENPFTVKLRNRQVQLAIKCSINEERDSLLHFEQTSRSARVAWDSDFQILNFSFFSFSLLRSRSELKFYTNFHAKIKELNWNYSIRSKLLSIERRARTNDSLFNATLVLSAHGCHVIRLTIGRLSHRRWLSAAPTDLVPVQACQISSIEISEKASFIRGSRDFLNFCRDFGIDKKR